MNILAGLWFIIVGGWIVWTTVYVLLNRHDIKKQNIAINKLIFRVAKLEGGE